MKTIRILLLFSLTMTILCFSQGSPVELSKQSQDDHTGFIQIQLQAIKAYHKLEKKKSWDCSFEEHMHALLQTPIMTPFQGAIYLEKLREELNGSKNNLVTGASSFAKMEDVFMDTLLIWEEMYVNSLVYYNVLYGRNETMHVGLGTPIPKSYFVYNKDKLLYYDLISCLPFPLWIQQNMNGKVNRILIVPRNTEIALRNSVHGVAALKLETMRDIMPVHNTTLKSSPTTGLLSKTELSELKKMLKTQNEYKMHLYANVLDFLIF